MNNSPNILGNTNEIILPCPHCKKNDQKIAPIWIYDSKTVKCEHCEKEYTIEIFKIPGASQAIVNVVPLVRKDICSSCGTELNVERICPSCV